MTVNADEFKTYLRLSAPLPGEGTELALHHIQILSTILQEVARGRAGWQDAYEYISGMVVNSMPLSPRDSVN